MKDEIYCPVDLVVINENKARFTAFFVLVLTVVFLITNLWFIVVYLAIDFFLRMKNQGKYSLLGILSDALIKQLQIKNKPTDRGPKRFAAGVGLFFSTLILVLVTLHLPLYENIAAFILAFFAFLESFTGFCAGCYVYTFLKKLSIIK